jgi:hypothetical protein
MDKKKGTQELEVSVNFDTTPVLYTDSISMTSNEDGIVLDVLQRVGNTNKVRIVSRIGMSRTHAKKFIKECGNLLAITEGQKQTGKTN